MKNTEMARILRIAANCLESAGNSFSDCVSDTASPETALVTGRHNVELAMQVATEAIAIHALPNPAPILSSLKDVVVHCASQANERAREIAGCVNELAGASRDV